MRLFAIVVIGVVVASIAPSCGLDVNAQEPFGFSILNDTVSPVIVRSCINMSCSQVAATYRLAPNQSLSVEGTADGILDAYKISTTVGRTVGCLPFRFEKRLNVDKNFKVSMNVPCRNDSGASNGTA